MPLVADQRLSRDGTVRVIGYVNSSQDAGD
jgi:hypothetical protein